MYFSLSHITRHYACWIESYHIIQTLLRAAGLQDCWWIRGAKTSHNPPSKAFCVCGQRRIIFPLKTSAYRLMSLLTDIMSKCSWRTIQAAWPLDIFSGSHQAAQNSCFNPWQLTQRQSLSALDNGNIQELHSSFSSGHCIVNLQ